MKKSILFGMMVLSIALSSCSSVMYQVYEVESPNLSMKNNSMVYQNDDCKVSYNLWDNQGSMTFIFENLTDKDIFIDMSQSFFIKNGAAYDYFKNRTWESRVYEGVEIGLSTSTTYIGTAGYWPTRYNVSLAKTAKAAAAGKAGREGHLGGIHLGQFDDQPQDYGDQQKDQEGQEFTPALLDNIILVLFGSHIRLVRQPVTGSAPRPISPVPPPRQERWKRRPCSLSPR